ncbi:PAS domain-containing protein [Phormidium sp. CLA17]|uniref:PAS domain-containing protein n=1 Tax=Leptolyngbya sp. Cla-17 TaxID=2803751 RepID=UPI0014925D5A|nr:PAS domain-containing protein [Leptolyngbya sp. Cla-17]MBM0744443.1 PAS domain-containing protein [Leptolyngbya sp. Cla-17]
MSLSRSIQDSLALSKRGQSKLSPANYPDTAKCKSGKGERFAVCAASEPERQQLSAMLYSYERIVSATPDCVSLIDRNYIYQVVNQTYLTWHQKAYDEIVGHSFGYLLGQDFFETVCKPLLDNCLAGATEQTVESWKDYGDGQRRYAKATYAPYVELDGTISGVVINVQDLTTLKQAELENQALQERMQFLLAASPSMVYSCEAGGNFACTYISENVSRMFGYTPSDFLGGSDFWAQRLHPDDAPKMFAGLPALFEQGHHSHEYRFRHRDGHYCWVQDDLRLIRNLEGEPLEIVGCWMMIDDRKAAEAALRQQQQLTEQIADSTLAILYVYDLIEQRNIYCNQQVEAVLGYSVDEIRRMDNDLLTLLIHPDDLHHLLASYQRLLMAQDDEFVETEYRVLYGIAEGSTF